jgi:hypothetical protein
MSISTFDRHSPKKLRLPRTTNCGALQDGPCARCPREGNHRECASERRDKIKRSDRAPDALQRRIRTGREYVRAYPLRGAIGRRTPVIGVNAICGPTALPEARPITIPFQFNFTVSSSAVKSNALR